MIPLLMTVWLGKSMVGVAPIRFFPYKESCVEEGMRTAKMKLPKYKIRFECPTNWHVYKASAS